MAESHSSLVSKASGIAEASRGICHANAHCPTRGDMHQFSIQNMYGIRIVSGPVVAIRAYPGKTQDSEEIGR